MEERRAQGLSNEATPTAQSSPAGPQTSPQVPQTGPQSPPPPEALQPTRRPRRSRKRTRFRTIPKMAVPVKALWEAASAEDQKRAHTRCMAILEMWLGKRTKREIAEELALPPLRLWQLSQQALSGMLAALIHQPRLRSRQGVSMPESEAAELKRLRKENADLKRQISVSNKHTEILRQMPQGKSEEKPVAPKRTKRSSKRVPAGAAGRKKPRTRAKGADLPGAAQPDLPGDPRGG
ncbi:MAG: hypothetical protein ACF8NJ_01000 [Phycisphaerales bacterium JB038]